MVGIFKIATLIHNQIQIIMKKSIVLGVATGAVAAIAAALIVKKLNLLDKVICRADGLTGKLSDFCDVIPKGEERNVSKQFK